MQLPETLIGTAIGIVIFPTLALLSSEGDLRGQTGRDERRIALHSHCLDPVSSRNGAGRSPAYQYS